MGELVRAALSVFKVELTIYGITFSMWQLFLFVVVAGLLIDFIVSLFD